MKFNDILALVATKTNFQPKLYKRGYILRCPTHEDKNPSFGISEGPEGKTLMHCFKGCTIQEICLSLGIRVRDLFPKN